MASYSKTTMRAWLLPLTARENVRCARSEMRLPISTRAVGTSSVDCCAAGSSERRRDLERVDADGALHHAADFGQHRIVEQPGADALHQQSLLRGLRRPQGPDLGLLRITGRRRAAAR